MLMKKHVWMLIILVSVILLLSCFATAKSSAAASSGNDSWTMFLHDTAHSGTANAEGSANSVSLLWKATVMDEVVSSPAVADGEVFVGCNDGAVYCHSVSTGKLVWFFYQNKTQMMSSPAVSGGSVFVGCNNGDVYALNESNGRQLWNYTTGGWVGSSPAIADGVVYVGSRDGNLYALNAQSGEKLWSFQTGNEVESSPAVSGGVVYFASDSFYLYALNTSTGKMLWQTHTGSTISSPSVSDGYIYIGSYDGYVCCLNASSGAKVWSYLTPDSVVSSPAVAYGCVYIGSEDNYVYCLNATSGDRIWRTSTGYWVTSSPAVAGGSVYVGSEDDNIYCLNASTGAKEWIYQTGSYVESSPAIVNNTLYVGSDDFHLYALSLINSNVETLPTQTTKVLQATTIALDVSACAVGALIVFAGAIYVRVTRRTKREAKAANISAEKSSWLSSHVDAVCVLMILAFSTIFFINLASGHLVAADEQTYSQWTFHMIKTGDYLTPWAFGSLFWVGKPPLVMWLMSLSYQIFGVNNFSARFWSPIFGALSLVLIYFLGKKLYNPYVGFMSAFVLGTLTTFYVYARLAMTDIPLVFFSLGTIYFFILSEKTEKTARYAVLSGLFFGLALMTKQIEALIVLLILVLYFAATKKNLRFLVTKNFTLFWAIGLLVFSPWLIYMAVRFGSQFWQWYFIYDVVNRSVGVVENHAGSYLYYFNFLAHNESLVYLILLPIAAAVCLSNAIFKRVKADTLIFLWMAIVMLVFTVAQSKLDWYILPAFPAFALAISSLLYLLGNKTYEIVITKLLKR
jgi:outer membrane protein assembly factor BamB